MADEKKPGLLGYFFKGSSGEPWFAGWGFLISVFGGWGIELLYALVAEPTWGAGFRTFCILWFASAAAFFAGTSGGFLFGVPKAISNPANTPTPPTGLYKINTNLEEISDWLTKIILGLGLVNLDKVIRFIDSIGEEVATAIGTAQGAKAIAISAMIYGFVCGFVVIYIWTRTSLKLFLEASERPPETRSGTSGTPPATSGTSGTPPAGSGTSGAPPAGSGTSAAPPARSGTSGTPPAGSGTSGKPPTP